MPKRILKKIFYYPRGAWNYGLMNLRGFMLKPIYQKNNINLKKECLRNAKQKTFFFTDNTEILTSWIDNNYIIKQADEIMKKKEISWLEDENHFSWSLDFYLTIRNGLYKDFDKGRDIKNIWEKARFFDAPILALAYLKTADEKYLSFFENVFMDFNSKNPWGYGPNWTVAMEVAIRICNLILAFKIFEKGMEKFDTDFSKGFKNSFLISVIKHGKFIEQNLECFPNKTNHFVADILGLVYIGFAFPELKKSQKYIRQGMQWLSGEMKNQVDNDGVDKEGSTQYHRLKLELFAYASLLYKLNRECNKDFLINQLDAIYWTKLHKMFEYSFLYTKPNQLSPQIGDDDGSRLHKLEDSKKYISLNHTYLIGLYNLIFQDLVGMFDIGKRCCLLKESGIGIMKTSDAYLFIGRKNPLNNRFTSHFHNDIGSFELNVNGKDFIVDPGTYCYTEDLKTRNLFRSTYAHNTLMINNAEQNEINLAEPFFINFTSKKNAKTAIGAWEDTQTQCMYQIQWKMQQSLISRSFILDKQKSILEIKDNISGDCKKNIQWFFHCSPDVKIFEKTNGLKENHLILTNGTKQIQLILPMDWIYEIKDDFVSKEWHKKIPSKTICITTQQEDIQKEYIFKFKL